MDLYFSIVIPTFNPDYKIAECINSICKSIKYFENHYKHNQKYEILIINDGGEKIDDKIPKNLSFFKIVNLKKNHGVGFARQFGLKISKYNYIFYIDSDIIIEQNTLFTLLTIFKNIKSNCGSLGALQHYSNLNTEPSSNFVSAKTCYGFDDQKKLINFSVIHSECCVVEKSFINSIGGWKFFEKSGGEEFDLGHRIILNNKKNFITTETRYKTYYENLFNKCNKLIYRTSNYLPVFLKKKKLESSGGAATFEQLLSVILTIFLVISIIGIYINVIFIKIFFIILLINFLVELNFLKFAMTIFPKKNLPLFLLGIFCYNISIFIGGILGLSRLIKK